MGNKNKTNSRKGIWISEEIIYDKNLDWTNKALLTEIYSLCELPDGCIASDNHFGKLLGIGRPSANKRVNQIEQLGYITTKNHYRGKQCIGRSILNGSSHDIQEVVIELEEGSSVENTINSSTNSDLTIQETIQYTGESTNTGISMNQFLENRYEELVVELVDKSSLGENIFQYIEPDNLSFFKDAVNEKEYKLVYPILTKIIDISRKLYGK